MRTYTYQGFDREGRRARGLVEADSLKAAREKLSGRGVLVERCDPVADGTAAVSMRKSRAAWSRPAVRSMVYRELSAMLKAGVPLARALGLLVESPEHEVCRSELAHIRDRIREGDPPPVAFHTAGPLSQMEHAAIEAGARAGAFDDTLRRLAEYLDAREAAMEKARSALMYPAFVAGFAVLMSVGVFGFLLPGFARIWETLQIDLPLPTRIMMAWGRHGPWALPAALLALSGGMLWIRRRWRTSPAFRVRAERRWARTPFAGSLWSAMTASRVARTLPMLLRGGVPLVEALEISGRASGSAWLAEEMRESAARVRQGGSVADAFRSAPPLAQGLAGWVEAGEASGDIASMLDVAADRLQQTWERKLQRAVALLEPAIIVVLGILILWIALAVILPIQSMQDAIGQGPAPL